MRSSTRRPPSPPLVGREQELRLLLHAAQSRPAVTFVEGEAGVGKSRLVRELIGAPAVQGLPVLVGRCHRMRQPLALGPLTEALRGSLDEPLSRPLSPVAGALRPLLPELGDRLPAALDRPADPKAERHRVFRALAEVLDALGPAVCILEDLHWADEQSLDFLSFLLSAPPSGLSLLITYRGEDLDPSSGPTALGLSGSPEMLRTTIALPPLSVEEVRRLAGALLEVGPVSRAFASYLHVETAGVPAAVEEVIGPLRDRGPLQVGNRSPEAQLYELEVPPRFRHAVRARLAALSGDARAIVRAAAVLGSPHDQDLLTEVVGLPPTRVAKALTEALSSALLEEKDGLYGFRQMLAARAVNEATHRPDRRRLHLRAAWALESRPAPRPLAQLAHHFKEADRPRKWVHYAEAAAEAASSAGDDRTAARILQEALGAPRLPRATVTRLALRLGDAALFGRVPREAILILRGLLDDGLHPVGVRGELRFSLARLLYLAGDTSSHAQLLRAAEELKRRPRVAARAMALLAGWEPATVGHGDRVDWLERALEAAARQRDPVVRTEILATRADVLLDLGDPAGWGAIEALPWSGGSVEQRLELVRATKYLAAAALRLGHLRRAESLLDEGERIRDELGHGRFAVGLATIRTCLEWSSGQWEGLEARARALIEASPEAPGMSGWSEEVLAWLLLAQGAVEDAEQRFTSVLDVVRKAGLPVALTTVTSGLARIQLADGNPHDARRTASMGLEEIREERLWACAFSLGPVTTDALLACGEEAEAKAFVRRLARSLGDRDAPAAKVGLALCRGALAEADGRPDLAARLFGWAERASDRMPCPYEAARARERRGRCLVAAEDGEGSRHLLGALERFHALGAAGDVARVRAELRAHGLAVPYPWRGGPRRYGDQLSPREAEVARMAGEGATNREIAEALFISRRTVENHVASVLRKLGLDSRRALSALSLADHHP